MTICKKIEIIINKSRIENGALILVKYEKLLLKYFLKQIRTTPLPYVLRQILQFYSIAADKQAKENIKQLLQQYKSAI